MKFYYFLRTLFFIGVDQRHVVSTIRNDVMLILYLLAVVENSISAHCAKIRPSGFGPALSLPIPPLSHILSYLTPGPIRKQRDSESRPLTLMELGPTRLVAVVPMTLSLHQAGGKVDVASHG
jgi:hypothetical protein